MNPRNWIILPLILLVLALTACNLSLTHEETESLFQVLEDLVPVLLSPTLPTCEYGGWEGSPCGGNCHPYLEVITGLDPTYSWNYPSLHNCHPTAYEISIATWDYGEENYFFPLQNPDVYHGIVDGIDPQTGGPPTSITTGVLLEPTTRYVWQVRALLNDDVLGNWTRLVFWTGPICDTSSLVPPELTDPADAVPVTDPNIRLSAWYTQDHGCFPAGYEFQLSTDPNFTQLETLYENVFYTSASPAQSSLTDCTQYYWRARAVNSDGVGPFSDAFTFETRFEIGCELGSVTLERVDGLLCYIGPDPSSEVVQSLKSGQEVTLLGYSIDPLWFVIDSPSFPGKDCWIPQSALAELPPEVLSAYPLITPPLMPTPTITTSAPTQSDTVKPSAPTITPKPVSDTSGPKVSGASASPNPALTTSPVTISATISDGSGVARATVYYKTGKSGYQSAGRMKSGGGNQYFLNIGKLTPAGTYTFRIHAKDSLGNANCSSGALDSCPGGSFVVNIP